MFLSEKDVRHAWDHITVGKIGVTEFTVIKKDGWKYMERLGSCQQSCRTMSQDTTADGGVNRMQKNDKIRENHLKLSVILRKN